MSYMQLLLFICLVDVECDAIEIYNINLKTWCSRDNLIL